MVYKHGSLAGNGLGSIDVHWLLSYFVRLLALQAAVKPKCRKSNRAATAAALGLGLGLGEQMLKVGRGKANLAYRWCESGRWLVDVPMACSNWNEVQELANITS